MITSHFEGEKRTLKEIRYLVSPIHDALKLLISSLGIIESNQLVVMGPHK
jgi:hypothetical protein